MADSRMLPAPVIKSPIGGWLCVAADAEQRAEGVERIEPPVEAEREFVAGDPVGTENDDHLERIMRDADIVVAAWGPLAKLPPHLRSRWREVVTIADRTGKRLHCFGTARDGQPRHTLMLAYDTPLLPWSIPPAVKET